MTLDEFEAVINAATPGPWDTSDIGPTELNRPHKKYIRIPEHEDALFIAAARTMSPRLIEAIKLAKNAMCHVNNQEPSAMKFWQVLADLEQP